MADLIDRQAAIDAMMAEVDDKDRPNVELRWWNMGLTRASKILEQLPSAEPKTGRWIPCKEYAREMLADKTVSILYDHYECSLCRCTLPNLLYNQDGEPFYKFCPNCGAKMEGDTDETD